MKKIIVLFLCAAMLWPSPISFAGPKGGKVVGGNAQIKQNGASTTINQTTDRAIINWNSFDINKNESVRHNMPSSNSAGLHRVVGGGGASQIAGSLQSNGNIYLVNPAGVVIHKGAKIDVNGFVATSRDISDQNFMKGNMVFDRPGKPDAKIINKGNISLKDNGLAALVAPTVRNDGVIAGKLGKVALGGSDAAWKLDMTGDDLIAFTLDEKAVNTLHSADGTPLVSVENNGKIKAEGGVVVMSAAQLDGFVGSVVNNGEISAASVESKGGKIIFKGNGDKVDLANNGKLDVSSQSGDGGVGHMSGEAGGVNAGKIDATGEKGGKVVLTGKDITLKSGSVIDASGKNGGGTVLVGGNAKGKGPEANAKNVMVQSDAEIFSSATQKGDGGQVVVWADEKTQFDGKIEAKGGKEGGNGGFVETSAKLLNIGDPAVVNTSAKKGKAGTWLMDPEDIVIAAANGTVSGKKLSEELELGNINIEGTLLQSIIIDDELSWHADTTLSIDANPDYLSDSPIILMSNINIYGDKAGLHLYPTPELRGGTINLYGNNQNIRIGGRDFIVVHNIEELQNIQGHTKDDDHFIIGLDIDASPTATWNGGLGFEPIQNFQGILFGAGHYIDKLYINRPEQDYVGLLGRSQADWTILSNLRLIDCNITGHDYVGSIAGEFCGTFWGSTGFHSGHLDYVSVSGSVKGNLYVGGIVGYNRASIDQVYNEASIIGNKYVGGITGVNDTSINMTYNKGEVRGIDYVGGITGINSFHPQWTYSSPSIDNSYNIGRVIGTGEKVGGFYGENNGSISQCYYSISLSGQNQSEDSPWLHGYVNSEEMIDAMYSLEDFERYWIISPPYQFPQLLSLYKYSNVVTPQDPAEPITPNPNEPTPVDPNPDDSTPIEPDPVSPPPAEPTNPVQPSNPQPSQPTQSSPSNPGNSNTGSTQNPVYDGNDEYGGNYIYVDNLPITDRQNFGFILPGTPVYVIDKEISSTKPEMYVVDLDKYNTNKDRISQLKSEINGLCDTVTKKGTFDIATTALRVEIQKLFSMFFNTEFLLDSKKFSSNTMKAIKSVLENDHAKNLLKSNSYRLTVGYYLVLYSYLDEAVAALNKAESILESPVRYADSTDAYRTYMREAEKYMDAARQVYANEPQITALFNEFAIYETAATFGGAITDTVVDKIDSKLSKFLIPDAGVMTKSVEQSIKMQAKKEAKAPLKMKTLTAEDIWQESTSFTLPSSGAKSIFERNFNEIFG